MRLNPDCIRDILLAVEEHSEPGNPVEFESASDYEQTKKYSDKEVAYHITQCEMSGLLTGVKIYLYGDCSINDLTPKGHEFLANIRSENNWSKVKKTAVEIGSNSLSAIAQIATTIISNAITTKFSN